MSKLQNRPTATVITALVVLFSILLGALVSLNGLRREAWQYFEYGYLDGARGIRSDLSGISGDAYNIGTVAERYLGANDPTIAAVERAGDNLDRAHGSPAATCAAAQELRGALSQLDAVLQLGEMNQEDENYRVKLMANIEGNFRRIEQSPYNQEAVRFNEKLEKLPARVLAEIVGMEPLELYQ